jgi:hypothetical protein
LLNNTNFSRKIIMTTTNKPMTGEQLDELMTVAVNMQRTSEEIKDRGAAMFAYAVQVAVMEVRDTRSKLAESQREFRSADATIENLQMQVEKLAAENAYLLNGAARELNTSWMFHKTMLGAQAALVCLVHGYQAAAREWLEGTTDEAGAEIPDDISVGELPEWFDSQMVSNDGNSGFLTREEAEKAIKAKTPATDAFLAEVRAQGVDALAKTLEGLVAVSVTRSYITEFAAKLRQGGAA